MKRSFLILLLFLGCKAKPPEQGQGINNPSKEVMDLVAAAGSGNLNDVRELLAKGVDPNIQVAEAGFTPLLFTVGLIPRGLPRHWIS